MLLYTLLFTLQGKDPAKNKYVDMLSMWLTYIVRHADLTANDTVMVLVDAPTRKILENDKLLQEIREAGKFQWRLQTIPQPVNLSQGLAERYKVFSPTEIHMFVDLDMLILDPIQPIMRHQKEAFFTCMPEGKLLETDYAGLLLQHLQDYTDLKGYTAGWFMFNPSDAIETFFTKIRQATLDNQAHPFYTVDQPYLNYFVLKEIESGASKLEFYFLDESLSVKNIYPPKPTTLFAHFCGDPGNDLCHLSKMVVFHQHLYQQMN